MISPAHEHSAPPRHATLRRLFRRGRALEEKLALIVDAHLRQLEEQRDRFERTIADLERREQLLSDAKASVERLLRLGSRDLDAREADIARLIAELTEREQQTREREEEVARRRSETGAVELKRLLVEQRERALSEREEALAEKEHAVAEHEREAARPPELAPALAFVPGSSYRLVELASEATMPDGKVVVDGEPYDVVRVGPSPLPGDERRCAYLVAPTPAPAS